MTTELLLILGGVASGKSALAQRLAEGARGPVLFVATAQPGDEETATRIARHRASRPSHWTTLEEPLRLPQAIDEALKGHRLVLLDCMTFWLSNLLMERQGQPPSVVEDETLLRVRDLLAWCQGCDVPVIIVSNEVGMGVVPPYPLGRQFRDLLGKANQLIAAQASKVYLLVAGLPIEVKALASRPTLQGEEGHKA